MYFSRFSEPVVLMASLPSVAVSGPLKLEPDFRKHSSSSIPNEKVNSTHLPTLSKQFEKSILFWVLKKIK